MACYYFLTNDDDDDDECPVPAQVDVLLVWMGLVACVAGLVWILGNGREEQHQGPIVVAAVPDVVIAVVPPVVVNAVTAPTGARAEYRPGPNVFQLWHMRQAREAYLKDPLAYYKRQRMIIDATILRLQRREIRTRAAAKRLQAMARMYLARVQMAKLKRKVTAARLVQQTWRSYRSSFLPVAAALIADDDDFPLIDHHEDDDDGDDDEELLGMALLESAESEAAVCLQAMARMYLARRRRPAARPAPQEQPEPPQQEPPEPAQQPARVVQPRRRRRQPARKCKRRPVSRPTRVQPDRACKNKARTSQL